MIVNEKRISWIYLTEEGVRSYYRHKNIKTRCIIKKGDVVIAVGDALCGQKDSFCRETGRKKSLGRALKELYPTQKAKRADVWDSYRIMGKHPKWKQDSKQIIKEFFANTVTSLTN